MNPTVKSMHITGWLAALLLLQGCAAATVIRKQPDFDHEKKQQLTQAFQAVPATVSRAERSALSR